MDIKTMDIKQIFCSDIEYYAGLWCSAFKEYYNEQRENYSSDDV